MTPGARTTSVDEGSLERLQIAALVAMIGGAAGSAGLMVYAAERVHAPRILLAGFVIWVLSPFVLMALGHGLSRRWRWSIQTRCALYQALLVITVTSLVVYGYAALGETRPKTAPFVLVAPASWLVFALVVTIAALRSRRQSMRTP
jgi:hypothetical protein